MAPPFSFQWSFGSWGNQETKSAPDILEDYDNEEDATEAEPYVVPGLEDLEDACFFSGLFDRQEQLENVLSSLRSERDSALEMEQISFKGDTERWQTLIGKAAENRANLANTLETLKDSSENYEEEISRLQKAKRELESTLKSLRSRLAKKRSEYPSRVIEEKINRHKKLSSALVELELANEEASLALQERYITIAQRRREINEKEYSRRVKELSERREEAVGRLTRLRNLTEKLRRVGITRTTYGYLIWAGYLSFPVFGWFLGEVIRRRSDTEEGIFAGLIDLLSSSIDSLSATMGSVGTLLAFLLGPLVLFSLVVLMMFAVDYLLRKFDRGRWLRGGRTASKRSGLMPDPMQTLGGDVARSDYTGLLAKFPIFYAYLLIPIVLALLLSIGRQQVGEDRFTALFADPWQSVFFTLVGVVTAVVIAGFVLLYVGRVIEGRFASKDVYRPIRDNLEVVLLGGVILASITIDEILFLVGAGPSESRIFWSLQSGLGVTFLIVLCGFVVGYGLISKGIFVDLDVTGREVNRLSEEMDRYSAYPALAVWDNEAEMYREGLRRLRADIERWWAEIERLYRPKLGWRGLFRSPEVRMRSTLPSEETNFLDSLLEPDVVEEIEGVRGELRVVEGEVEVLKGRVSDLEKKIGETEARQSEEKKLEQRLEARIARRRKTFQERWSSLGRYYLEAIGRCEVAFQLGRHLRGDFKAAGVEVVEEPEESAA